MYLILCVDDSMKNVDYSKLDKSEKFTPALYHETKNVPIKISSYIFL